MKTIDKQRKAYLRQLRREHKQAMAARQRICSVLSDIPVELQEDIETIALWRELNRTWRAFDHWMWSRQLERNR